MKIKVGARSSPLSKVQVGEVYQALRAHHPDVIFDPLWIETTGDLDLKTSLLSLEKTNFFTKELDEMLIRQEIDVAIHSAKDLPEPLSAGLEIVAITEGISSRDVLVLRERDQVKTLPQGARIGTSSLRRIAALKELREDLEPVDIRGTIERRLALLEEGEVDGVVIAEAALIRLGIQPKSVRVLIGESAPLQGKLAVVARAQDSHMKALFSGLDTR